jgi:Cu+-exporting ATPase
VLASIRHVDTVVLAGTGALTSGRMSLQTVYPAAGVDPGEALRMAGAVGQDAADPIGAELAAAARIAHGELPGVSEFDDLPELGARGLVSELDGEIVRAHAVLLGRPALLAEHGVDLPDELATAVAAAHAEGVTAVVVAWDGTARAVLTLAATVRPGGAAAVARLRALGMRPVLVTRDEAAVAARIAVAVGIGAADVEAGTAPAAGIRALQADGRVVLVVGPGSTGAAALTMADLDLAVDAVRLARRTLSVIRWNLGLAVAPTAAALPVAVGGLLSPGIAGAALVVSALLVLINSGRLRWCGGGVRRAPGGWQESHLPATDSRESGIPANPASAPTPVER